MASYEELRIRHQQTAAAMLPEMLERVDWPAERLATYREKALRSLIAKAKAGSSWYAKRLSHVDAEHVTEADLQSIPPMTKADLMENFDAIVTDRRLNLERCEAHLPVEVAGGGYLDEEFRVSVSGGSSGVRAVAVFSWEEFARDWTTLIRLPARWASRAGIEEESVTIAVVMAASPVHGSQQLARTFVNAEAHSFSVGQPIEETVAGLNQTQPAALTVYPSVLPRLAAEAAAGRLRIQPTLVVCGSEPVLPEHESAAAGAWGCPIVNVWGATEVGMLGMSSGFDPGMLLFDDHAIVEPVDDNGRPVKPGDRAAMLYVTPLFRHTLPVIRYQLTDQLTMLDEPASCGSGFRRISHVEGRLDDHFTYLSDAGECAGEIDVHPHVFRSTLGRERGILEYQVRQTAVGADIAVTTAGALDTGRVARKIESDLAKLGLANAQVTVFEVPCIERTGDSTKLKRFIPLDPSSQRAPVRMAG